MMPNLPDGGLVSDIYHLGKRGSFEARKRGDSDQTFKLLMSAALIVMGCKMGMEAFEKMRGGRGR